METQPSQTTPETALGPRGDSSWAKAGVGLGPWHPESLPSHGSGLRFPCGNPIWRPPKYLRSGEDGIIRRDETGRTVCRRLCLCSDNLVGPGNVCICGAGAASLLGLVCAS